MTLVIQTRGVDGGMLRDIKLNKWQQLQPQRAFILNSAV
jgi:hypothetical protein